MRRLLLLGLAACSGDAITVAPVIDVPANDTASAFPLDSLTLSAAHAGNDVDITAATFTKGQASDLGGVPFGDDLVLHMVGRIGTSDIAYGRTCTFAVNQNATVPQPHLYFSRTVKFGQLGFEPLLRADGTAVTYHDGSAIMIGGITPDGSAAPVTDVERFDPRTGEYRPLTSIAARVGAVVALAGTGTETLVTVIGGTDPMGVGATFVETIEAENPADRRVNRVDDTSMARVGLTATTLTNGNVIVMGGSGAGSACMSSQGSGSGDPSACVEEITLSNGTPMVRPAHDSLLHGRWDHTATRLGDDVGAPVLVAGGVGSGGGSAMPIADVELYKPLTGQFSTFPNGRPTMSVPRSRHRALRMPDGSVLFIGGIDKNGNGVKTLESFTLDGGFTTTGTLPDNAGLIDFTATTLPDGRVLITGGRMTVGGDPVATAFILQLNTDTNLIDIVATDRLTVPRAGHGATVMCDGTVLISGGTVQPAPAERYNPIATGRR